jgi:hypothetical protein
MQSDNVPSQTCPETVAVALFMSFSIVASIAFLAIWIAIRGILEDTSEAILVTTGRIILWYTVETWGLRWQMVLQNEIAIRLVLIAYFVVDATSGPRLQKIMLRNIGKGPALYIQFCDIEIASDPGVKRYVVKFDRTDFLEAGKETVVGVGVYDVREGRKDYRMNGFIDSFDPNSANKSYDVTITYEDIKGRKHESIVQMGKEGNKLLTHGKV